MTTSLMTRSANPYFVIPLSIQRDGEIYVVGNIDLGDFYHFPEIGVRVLNLLRAGTPVGAIKGIIVDETPDDSDVDVENFVEQLESIGFIYPEAERGQFDEALRTASSGGQREFKVDARIARLFFSHFAVVLYSCVLGYAGALQVAEPALRINWSSFYTETNKTAFVLVVLALSLVTVALHEIGHMLAIARYGIKSRYGISNRLWVIVAESDLTGTMALPKSKRYLPLFAGMLVDLLIISTLTISLHFMFALDFAPFAVQVVQAIILQIVLSIVWQFNVFVKTDVYYVLSNYFTYPDLDRDARIYLANMLYSISRGRLGRASGGELFKNKTVLRLFTAVWLFGRVASLLIYFGIFLPTIWQYIVSGLDALQRPGISPWVAYDTLAFALISLSFSGIGMYMWLGNRRSSASSL
jgi:hypothetical protein